MFNVLRVLLVVNVNLDIILWVLHVLYALQIWMVVVAALHRLYVKNVNQHIIWMVLIDALHALTLKLGVFFVLTHLLV